MPKNVPYTLAWQAEQEAYELRERSSSACPIFLDNEERWPAHLATLSSFSFQGKHGRMTLLKEARQRGDSYWYAYRRQGKQTVKKYLGRSNDLTIARLEEAAQVLNHDIYPTLSPLRQNPRAINYSSLPNHAALTPAPPPLLEPKLRPPHPRPTQVSRPLLQDQLDMGLERKLTLLSAPAGFGKTTLVSTWLAASQAIHLEQRPLIAWIALDAGDNEPLRFWRYIFTASRAFDPLVSETGLAILQRLHGPSIENRPEKFESSITTFINALTHLQRQCVLILEDYHIITRPWIHETLTFLLDHLPANLHIFIISRNDPPLPLARLRASDDCIELRAADLRFSQNETRLFLQQTLSSLPAPEIVESVATRTEGWVAGLRLITLAVQGRKGTHEIEHFLTTLMGGHRHIVEYLVNEVFNAQSVPIQDFLLRTCILDRLTASLCNAVTGRDDSVYMLDQLTHANLFLESLDTNQQWYRYHTMFAEAMRYEAVRRFGESGVRSLYALASRWHETQNALFEAIETALLAQDFVRAADLIERVVAPTMLHRELYTIRRWLEGIPQDIIYEYPTLCFVQAIVLLFTRDRRAPDTFSQIETCLVQAEQKWRAVNDQTGLGSIAALRSLALMWQGQNVLSFQMARQALTLLPAEEALWRGISLVQVGLEEVFAGRPMLASAALTKARVLCEATQNYPAALAATLKLSNVLQQQGQLHQAHQLCQQVLKQAKESGDDLYDRGSALLGLAKLAFEWNDLEQATLYASQALMLGQQLHNEAFSVSASILLIRIAYIQQGSVQVQEQLHTLLASTKNAQHLRKVYACAARIALANNDLVTAQRMVQGLQAFLLDDISVMQQEQETLLMARLSMAREQFDEALHLLECQRCKAQDAERTHSIIIVFISIALVYQARGDSTQAQHMLLQALEQARAEKYQRVFLDEGMPMLLLLRDLLPQIRETPPGAYVRALLRAFAQEQVKSGPPPTSDLLDMTETLSPQERRVLRLLANGHTNSQIATLLVVSINTIKTQIKSIYRKLQITDRQGAREAAQMLGLL